MNEVFELTRLDKVLAANHAAELAEMLSGIPKVPHTVEDVMAESKGDEVRRNTTTERMS